MYKVFSINLAVLASVGILILCGCASTPNPSDTVTLPGKGFHLALPPNLIASTTVGTSEVAKSPGFVALEEELGRASQALSKENPKPYFIAYHTSQKANDFILASNGGLIQSGRNRTRFLDVDVRIGDYAFDSTHPMSRDMHLGMFTNTSVALPLDEDPTAMKIVAWRETERQFRNATGRFFVLKTNQKVDMPSEDRSHDFSREPPTIRMEAASSINVDRTEWENRVRALSGRLAKDEDVLDANVSFHFGQTTDWLLTTEGTRIQTAHSLVQVAFMANTRAEDGQTLYRREAVFATAPHGIESRLLEQTADRLIVELKALKQAKSMEPFTGPAILEGRAAAVFFHEILGHRLEGHRQRNEQEGQTFTKKLGSHVLPSFLSVYDDPFLVRFGSVELNGHYSVDDEGVLAQRVSLVENGVLKNFLYGRMPAQGVMRSNGHGRKQTGRRAYARQANLVIVPSMAMDPGILRDRLKEEAQKRGLTFGLRFSEIEGGFTNTHMGAVQAFRVIPQMVYKVFVDGRPDELVRNVNLVGTPLLSLTNILAAGDDYGVFNGVCGAESGFIPVSSISPSLLLGEIEIERAMGAKRKKPVLTQPAQDVHHEVQP